MLRLKRKYEELEVNYHTESAFSKHQSVLAQELQAEIDDLRDQYQQSLETIESGDQVDHFTDHTNKNLGAGHAPAKTLRLGPQTLRLANIDSDTFNASQFHQMCTSPSIKAGEHKRMSTTQFLAQTGRLSVLYDGGDDTQRSMQYIQYETDRTNTLSDDDHHDGDMKLAQDYDLENIQNGLKEQLQTEFDDRLAKEKGKLIDKHKLEMDDLRQQFIDITNVMKGLKRKLITKEEEIEKLRKRDGLKCGRLSMHTNPNNQQELSKCKVFGWVAW